MNAPSRSYKRTLPPARNFAKEGGGAGMAGRRGGGWPLAKKQAGRFHHRQSGPVVFTCANAVRSKARTPIRKFRSPAANQERWQVDRPIQER